MNIEDFILTALFSAIFGLIIGYFSRDITGLVWRLYEKHIRKPKHLIKYHFEDNGNSDR